MKKVVFLAVVFASCLFVTSATAYVTATPVMKSASSSDTPPSVVVAAFILRRGQISDLTCTRPRMPALRLE